MTTGNQTTGTPAVDTGRPTFPHFPALDGVRGLSVAVVLVFHGGFAIASGGFLGVSTFFTLSGFLITSLLLTEKDRSGTIALGAFWKRRFKRLLPAAVACIGLIAFFWSILDLQSESDISAVDVAGRIPGDLWAGLFYVYNWRAAFPPEGAGYNALFGEVIEPSPAAHFWSLSIEEQFYVFFPLLAAVILAYLKLGKKTFGGILVAMLALSVASPFLLDGFDRIYNGTDVRAAEILVGALLAVVFSTRRGREVITSSAVVTVAGVLALVAVVWLWVDTTLASEWLLNGGLFGYGLLSVLIIMAATQATGPVAVVLSWGPLRWLGGISYGVYLYHWPIFRWVDESTTGLDKLPLFILRLAITLVFSWLSLHYLENPIRRGGRPGQSVKYPVAALGLAAAFVGIMVVTYQGVLVDDEAPIPFEEIAAQEALSTTVAPDEPEPTVGGTAVDGTTGTGSGPAPTTTVAEPELVLEDRPPVLSIIGDSVATNIRNGLIARAAALGLPPLAEHFTFPGCINTYGEGRVLVVDKISAPCRNSYDVIREMLDNGNPDAFVVVGSSADLLPYAQPGSEDFVGLDDPDRYNQVKTQLAELQELTLARNISLVWVTVPCIEQQKADISGINPADVAIMNDVIYDLVADAPPQVALYDLYADVCPDGEYTPDVFGIEGGRDDGLHFTAEASGHIAVRIGAVAETVSPLANPS